MPGAERPIGGDPVRRDLRPCRAGPGPTSVASSTSGGWGVVDGTAVRSWRRRSPVRAWWSTTAGVVGAVLGTTPGAERFAPAALGVLAYAHVVDAVRRAAAQELRGFVPARAGTGSRRRQLGATALAAAASAGAVLVVGAVACLVATSLAGRPLPGAATQVVLWLPSAWLVLGLALSLWAVGPGWVRAGWLLVVGPALAWLHAGVVHHEWLAGPPLLARTQSGALDGAPVTVVEPATALLLALLTCGSLVLVLTAAAAFEDRDPPLPAGRPVAPRVPVVAVAAGAPVRPRSPLAPPAAVVLRRARRAGVRPAGRSRPRGPRQHR